MTVKYTRDKLIEILLQHNQEVAVHMSHIANALENLNDSNTLHSNAINANSEAIKQMAETNGAFIKFFRWVMVAIILALIVLAGAEEALKFVPTG